MAVSNDIPWLGFLTADIRGARAPDAPVCSAAGREGVADKTGPPRHPHYLFHLFILFAKVPGEADGGLCLGPVPQSHWSLSHRSVCRTAPGKQLAFPETHHHCSPFLHLSPSGLTLSYFPALWALRSPRRLCRPHQCCARLCRRCRCGLALPPAPRPPGNTRGDALGRRRGGDCK